MSAVPLRARPWVIRLATTIVAWFVAFLIVFALLALFGRTLESLPYALNALVFTGVLVPIMGNLVMPFVGGAIARRMAGAPTPEPTPPERDGAGPEAGARYLAETADQIRSTNSAAASSRRA